MRSLFGIAGRANSMVATFCLCLSIGVVHSAAPNPIHWWSGDGSTHDRAGDAPGTILANVTYDEGRFGKSFRFDGIVGNENGVTFGQETGNLGTNDFTITLWVKVESGTEIITKRKLCGHAVFWDIRYVDGGLLVAIEGTLLATLKAPMSKGEWHHVAFSREGPILRLYVDGVLAVQVVNEKWADHGVDNDSALRLGAGACGLPLKGWIDEVRIYNQTLTPAEVAAQANAQAISLVDRARMGTRRLAVDLGLGNAHFTWIIEPDSQETFAVSTLEGVELEATTDLKSWKVVPGAVRLVEGKLEVVDSKAPVNGGSYYRLAYRNPRLPVATGGAVPVAKLPGEVLAAARAHIESFVGSLETRLPEDREWTEVQFAPEARQVFDPGYAGGLQPALIELKLLSDRGAPRGYLMIAVTGSRPTVVEFAQEGPTKTERAQAENGGRLPHRFLRFNGSFMALEDAAGTLVGSLGTWPSIPAGQWPNLAPAIYQGTYDSEAGQRTPLASRPIGVLPASGYAAVRAAFAANPVRRTLAQLRTAAQSSRNDVLAGSRLRLNVAVGETRDVVAGEIFVSARLDVDGDDDLPSVRVSPLDRGFRVLGLRPGSDLVRARTRDGRVLSYTVGVTNRPRVSLSSSSLCRVTTVHRYTAGTGWTGDQRQYHQARGDFWCPAVGCGPAALAMLCGWWDVNGVPSAFYRLRNGFGEAAAFRFEYESLREDDAGKTVSKGETLVGPGGIELYKLSLEEAVMHDFHKLCNTFCVDGQGATFPWDMTGGMTEYLDRAVKNLAAPQNEFGEQFIGAVLQFSYTDGYWVGMTDWAGGGVMVAEGIKQGRPGIVGLGDTLFDLHYALAFGYRRVDVFEGCGTDRELVDRRRWFKCNMGWGPNHEPEWHDAESIWFGLTARLWQKHLPQPN